MKTKEVVMTEFFNTTKVINELCKGAIKITGNQDSNSGWNYIQVGTKKQSAVVNVKLTGSFEKKELEKLTLSAVDRDIMDAVFSLYIAEEMDVTPEMIIRAYSGNPQKDTTDKFQEFVENTLDKLMRLTIQIECVEQLELMQMSTRNNKSIYKGPLMSLEKRVECETAGKKTVYHISGMPVLYQYALMVKHIGGVSSELLNIPGKRTSKEDTMIARYLIRRISAMKNKKNAMKSRHIVYERRSDEGMLRQLGYSEEGYKNWSDKKFKIHRTVIRYLDHFVEFGYISGYVILKKKRSLYGVEIKL